MIAPWLKQHLEETGRWNLDGVGRTIRASVCRGCHAQVLTGLDADTCGIPVTADPAPLSALGEALAVLAGRHTYRLRRSGMRFELDHRHPVAIAYVSADDEGFDVLAAHDCNTAPLPTTASVYVRPRRQELPDAAPF